MRATFHGLVEDQKILKNQKKKSNLGFAARRMPQAARRKQRFRKAFSQLGNVVIIYTFLSHILK